MAAFTEFQQYVLDQLEPMGDVRPRKMFGGVGVYVDEVFCAILSSSSRFYLRVDDRNRGDFEAEGMEQFPGRGGAGMPYYEVPADVLEDAEQLAAWVGHAREAAVAAGPKKRPATKKATKKKAARKKDVKPRKRQAEMGLVEEA